MKRTILNIVLVALAAGTGDKTYAQMVRTIVGDYSISCKNVANKPGETIVEGAWGMTTDKSGNLVITDKNNTVVRMLADAGKIVIGDKGLVSNANYPFNLVVDKCGNLHITDNTIYLRATAQAPTILPHETSSWSDPDISVPVEASVPVATNNR